jgi:predicted transglutaminase-like cysteine proteinase
MCRKRRLLTWLGYVAALALLMVSGLSCAGGAVAHRVSATSELTGAEPEFRSYITPRSPLVAQTLQDILGAPPYEICQAGFDEIRDWVATNIQYVSDQERWGVDEYWQTPEETLSLRTGDCEDFAVLLCSLARGYGVDARRVYVAIGVDNEKHEHAFLIEDWNGDGQWRRIEPQAAAGSPFWYPVLGVMMLHPDSRLEKYEITAACNDLYYYDDEPFSESEEQTEDSLLTRVIAVAGDIAARLAQMLRYLLGLLLN